MRKLILIAIPLLLMGCGHKESEAPTVTKTVTIPARAGKKSVAINPTGVKALEQNRQKASHEQRSIEWNGKKYVIYEVSHRTPENPALPGYALSFSGIELIDGSRTLVMMQLPDRMKVGKYQVRFDPERGGRLGKRDKGEMSVIGQVVRTNAQGGLVTDPESSAIILKEGVLECTAISETDFTVKATLRTEDGNQYTIHYSGPMNLSR